VPVLLGLIAWPTAQQIAVDGVEHEKLVWLALMYGPFVSVLAVVSVWCYSYYRLDAAAHRKIVDALEVRRATSPVADAPVSEPRGGAGVAAAPKPVV